MFMYVIHQFAHPYGIILVASYRLESIIGLPPTVIEIAGPCQTFSYVEERELEKEMR